MQGKFPLSNLHRKLGLSQILRFVFKLKKFTMNSRFPTKNKHMTCYLYANTHAWMKPRLPRLG